MRGDVSGDDPGRDGFHESSSDTVPSAAPSRSARAGGKSGEQVRGGAGPGQYTVVKCGTSGHNIRSACSLAATAVGMLPHDAVVTATSDVVNVDGTWIQLDDVSKDQYCHDQDGARS